MTGMVVWPTMTAPALLRIDVGEGLEDRVELLDPAEDVLGHLDGRYLFRRDQVADTPRGRPGQSFSHDPSVVCCRMVVIAGAESPQTKRRSRRNRPAGFT